jgi:adenine-specific DNA-methyltransferase
MRFAGGIEASMGRRNGTATATLPLFGKADTCDQFDTKATSVILAGDSAETLRTVPDESVKLIITSPPYNLGKLYEEATHLDAYLENLTPIVDQLVRILSNDGSLCWQVGNFVNED